jgi:hypothetical protein
MAELEIMHKKPLSLKLAIDNGEKEGFKNPFYSFSNIAYYEFLGINPNKIKYNQWIRFVFLKGNQSSLTTQVGNISNYNQVQANLFQKIKGGK